VSGVALALLTVYGILTLGIRIVVQVARTGSTGFKGLSGGPVEQTAGLLFVGGIALSVAGAMADGAGSLDPIAFLDGDVGRDAGIGLAAGGLVTTFAAQLAMGDAWRIGVDPSERTELVTDGPFSVVRNPIYAGMIPFFFGIALLVPNVVAVAGAVLVFVGLELQTRLVEEPYLMRTHGDEYARYASRVGRFGPGLGRLG
jgi:protein-S-isoprenylcysteine O-methyltransferase Ste14